MIISADGEKVFFKKLSIVSFYIFVFFIFFNTSLPFGEKSFNLEEVSTSNPLNQLIFGSLLIISLLIILSKRIELKQFLIKDRILSLFLIWALLTVVWSGNSDVSLKRFILFLSTITVPLSFLMYSKSSEDALEIFYRILVPYIIISIVSVLVTPLAHDFDGTWRGLVTDKNGFGQISLIALIIFLIHFKKSNSLKVKLLDSIFIMISFTMLVGSRSSTVLFAFLFLLAIWLLAYLEKIFNLIGMGKFIVFFIFINVISIIIFFSLYFPQIFEPIVGAAGKNLTFTGRIDLWADIWRIAQKHILYGAGFRGFWVIDDPKLLDLYNIYVWIPIQAHNGYLDIINETGLVGMTLFIGIIIHYFFLLKNSEKAHYWKWFIFASLIINLTESKFITPKAPLSVMFLFAYLSIVIDSYRYEKKYKSL